MLENFFNKIISVFADLISAIPVPEWMQNLTAAQLHPTVLWVLGELQVGYGIGIILSAYTLRFLVRRLPIVG